MQLPSPRSYMMPNSSDSMFKVLPRSIFMYRSYLSTYQSINHNYPSINHIYLFICSSIISYFISYLFIHLSICQSIYISTYQPYISIYLSIYLSIMFIYSSAHLSIYPSLYLFIYLSIISIHSSVHLLYLACLLYTGFSFDWKKLKTARDAYIARLNGIYSRMLGMIVDVIV